MFIGDFDPDDLFEMVKKYFEPIPRGSEDPPDVVTLQLDQVGARQLAGEADCRKAHRITTFIGDHL